MYLVIDYSISVERPMDMIVFLKGLFDDQVKACACVKDWFISKQIEINNENLEATQVIDFPNFKNAVCYRCFLISGEGGERYQALAAFEVPEEIINSDINDIDGYEIPIF